MAVEKSHPAHPDYKRAWPRPEEMRALMGALGISRGDRVILDKIAVAWSHCLTEPAELIDATYRGIGKDGQIVYRRHSQGGDKGKKIETEEFVWPDMDVGYGPCGEGFRTSQNVWKHPAHARAEG
ncbi:hypothetical protein K2P56_03805 [Patescibacteria group bacterium]|nr:hypothetical protein [Patescibacteria group bacterium]